MQQTYPKISANNLGMLVSKRSALIGVEFIGDPPTLDCLLERYISSLHNGILL